MSRERSQICARELAIGSAFASASEVVRTHPARLLMALIASLLSPHPVRSETVPPPAERVRQHWAFQPLPSSVTSLPSLDERIQSNLGRHGLTPNLPASPRILIRRVALLLTGLPPTLEEISAFLQDTQPGAYSRMVTRYLNSPRFGERWAKLWLDTAGYADSNGYFNADTDRPLAYRYRDYVIRALNQDKPYPQFIREQLAGNELTSWKPGIEATPQIIELLEASHFLRNGQDGSGESDGNPDEVRVDRYYALESSLQIIGSSLLGLTLQCAKCHDHKFEPVTQKDYYSLQAFLYPAFHIEKWLKPNDRVVEAPLPGEKEKWESNEKKLDAQESQLKSELSNWIRTHRIPGQTLFRDSFDDTNLFLKNWSATAPQDDAPGGSPAVQLLSNQGPAAQIQDAKLQIIEGGGSGDRWLSTRQSFDWLPKQTGEWIQVTFDLIDTRLTEKATSAERIGYFISLHDFNDNSSLEHGNILIDGHPGGPTAVNVDYPGPDSKGRGSIGSTGYKPGRNYGVRVTRLSTEEASLEHLVDGAVDGEPLKLKAHEITPGGFGFEYCCGRSFVVDNVTVESSKHQDPDWVKKDQEFQSQSASHRKIYESSLKEIRNQRTPKPGRIAWVSAMSTNVPKVALLKRGNPKTPGDEVYPAYPEFLRTSYPSRVPPPDRSRNEGRRKALADWITEPGSPQSALLARVAVNRIWQNCFGVGLVATPDNLGLSGSPPMDPMLLDELCARWVQSGWSTKQLLQLILESQTFRQASTPNPQGVAKDPENRWLWRYPVRLLDAESIRDSILHVSGKLSSKSIGPYIPTPRSGNGEVLVDEKGPESFARSIFLQQRRTQVTTFLGVFDAPSIVFNCTRRANTTMPLQSLSLLNSEFAVKRGQDFADRILKMTGPNWKSAVQHAFEIACGRLPDTTEETSSLAFLESQRVAHQDNGIPAHECSVKAWADFCHSMFALNAFLYLE